MSLRPKNSKTPKTGKIKNHRFGVFGFKRLSRPLSVVLIFAIIGSLLAYLAFAQQNGQDYDDQTLPAITANPPLVSQSCLGGLYISLVADNSGSIGNQLGSMQESLRGFISSLLPSTKTQFSVSRFASNGQVMQPFTNNVSLLHGAINQFSLQNDTNWTAGLQAGYSTFSGVSPATPKLLIIATDGDPTEPEETSLSGAMVVANQIKAAGIHILAIGVGKGVNNADSIQRLKYISGPDVNTDNINTDVVTSDFESLSSVLIKIATNTCSSGTGTGGNGNGSGGTGNGSGTGGTGTGNNGAGSGQTGTGTGTVGSGKGNTGTGTGTGIGTTPNPSPTPQPTAAQGVTPSPAPTNVPDQQPTPAPAAVPTPDPSPTPAPTPMSQGVKTKPPQPQPSPFYDGKEYAPGSTPDDFVASKRAKGLGLWLYAAVAAVVLAAAGGGYWYWRKKKTSAPTKPKSKRRGKKI